MPSRYGVLRFFSFAARRYPTLRRCCSPLCNALPSLCPAYPCNAFAILIGATLFHALAPLRYADHRRIKSGLFYAIAVQRVSCRCLSIALLFDAGQRNSSAILYRAFPPHFTARLCHTVAGLVRAYRSRCVSFRCLSMPSHINARPCHSFAMLCCAEPFRSFANHHISMP